MLKTIALYNEKGNVKSAVRNAVKEKAMPILIEGLETTGREVTVGTDGALYVALALTENGETISARLEVTISVKDPNAPVKEAVSKAEVITVEF